MKTTFRHSVRRTTITTAVCATVCLLLKGFVVSASSVPIEHPMTVINQADLAVTKARIASNVQPQKNAYTKLISDANTALNFTPNPPVYLQISDGPLLDPARNLLTANGNAAYTLALAWLYSNETQYADKAVSIMKAWSDQATYIYGGNPGLHTGSSFIGMIQAADILHDYSGWSQADRKAFEDFWRTRIMPLQLQVLRGPAVKGNWGDHAGNAIMVAAIAFEDFDLRNEVIQLLYDQFDYPAPSTPNGWTDSVNRPKFQVNQGNDGIYYPCLPHEATRTSGDTYMGINYHGFAFTSHSGLKESARYAGVDLYDENTRYTDTASQGRNTNMREVFEQYYRWNFLKESVPGGPRFNWGNKTDIQYQNSPNSVEIMYNNYYDTLTPEIRTAMASWLNSNRPVGNKGDGHATLNKGQMIVTDTPVCAPSYSPHGGQFTGTRSVTITSLTEGAQIRYTTDGSTPISSSALYSGPITISDTTVLKARAFKSGMTNSLIASETYTKVTLPQSAVLGLTNGSSTTERVGNYVDAFKFTASSDFTAENMNILFADTCRSGGGIRIAIYSDNNGTPGTLLGQTGSFAVGPGLRTASLESPVQMVSGTPYWFATWMARSPLETYENVGWDHEKAVIVANNSGTRYSVNTKYSTSSTTYNASVFSNFPAGSAFASSGSVTYTVYATGTDPIVDPPVDPETKTFSAAADSYVRGGSYAGDNYGSDTLIQLKDDSQESYDRRGYIKFDLSGENLAYVASAKLRMQVYSVGASCDVTLYETSDGWTESGITWNNAPAMGSSVATVTATDAGVYVEWDVTNYVNKQLRDNKKLNLAVWPTTAGPNVSFRSKDAGAGKPQLVIEYYNPETQTFSAAADSYVRGGTYAGDNYGSDTLIQLKDDSQESYDRRGYIKFDLSGENLVYVTGAKLRMQVYSVGASCGVTLYETSDGWTESGITWNNAPAMGSSVATVTATDAGVYVEWDVTDYVNKQLRDNKKLNLAVWPTAVGPNVSFRSKDAGAGKPQLVIEYYTPETQTLSAAADSYVRGGTYAGDNYGSDPLVQLKDDSQESYDRRGYIRFDLSGENLVYVTGAKLRMQVYSVSASCGVTLYETSDGWTESGITWNNAPAVGDSVATVTVTDAGVYVEWDVTDYVNRQLSGNKNLNLALFPATVGPNVTFRSKDASIGKPQLTIYY